MIVVVAKFKSRPDTAGEVERELRGLVEYVRNEEPDTLTYVCHRAQSDPSQFLFYERYRSMEALSAHGSSGKFRTTFKKIGPMLEGDPVIELYEEMAGKS